MSNQRERVPDELLDSATREAIARLARRHGWRLVTLFGSAAHGAPAPRDLDIAVMPPPGTFPDLLEEGRWLAELEALLPGRRVDLLVLTDATDPVARYEALWHGLPLHEAEPGVYDHELSRAFFLYADSAKFRRARREALRSRHAMPPTENTDQSQDA